MSEFKYNAEAARCVSDSLNYGFGWDKTKHKRAFWKNVRNAFNHLAEDDVLEFEESIATAVSLAGTSAFPDYGLGFHMPIYIRTLYRSIDEVFAWSDTMHPQFWMNLHEAFVSLEDNDIESFNHRVDRAVESYK